MEGREDIQPQQKSALVCLLPGRAGRWTRLTAGLHRLGG